MDSANETPMEAPIVEPIVESPSDEGPRDLDDVEEYRFVIEHDRTFLYFHVQFSYLGNDLFFDNREEGDNVFIWFDFSILDWFKAFAKSMGMNEVPNDELVKHIALTFWEDF